VFVSLISPFKVHGTIADNEVEPPSATGFSGIGFAIKKAAHATRLAQVEKANKVLEEDWSKKRDSPALAVAFIYEMTHQLVAGKATKQSAANNDKRAKEIAREVVEESSKWQGGSSASWTSALSAASSSSSSSSLSSSSSSSSSSSPSMPPAIPAVEQTRRSELAGRLPGMACWWDMEDGTYLDWEK
jgi:hypothetical protein